jgi:hypothetical protein
MEAGIPLDLSLSSGNERLQTDYEEFRQPDVNGDNKISRKEVRPLACITHWLLFDRVITHCANVCMWSTLVIHVRLRRSCRQTHCTPCRPLQPTGLAFAAWCVPPHSSTTI